MPGKCRCLAQDGRWEVSNIWRCGVQAPVPVDGKLLPTAALAHLLMPDDWSDLQGGAAQLASITRARSVAETEPAA